MRSANRKLTGPYGPCVTMGLSVLIGFAVGCEQSVPSTPSTTTTPAASSVTPVAYPPASVTEVLPNIGSTGGGTNVRLTGTGFRPITAVTVGGTRASAFFANDSFFFTTPAHVAGPADIIVWDRDVEVASMAGGFVYTSPEVFDFNGEWEGGYGPDWQVPIRFTVRNNTLISIACNSSDLSLLRLPSITDGAFSVSGTGGVIVTGRITSPGHAVGTLGLAPCDSFLRNDYWAAAKVP